MNRNVIIGTALVILVISAVLYVINSSPGDSVTVSPEDAVLPVTSKDTAAAPVYPDSIVKLDASGYSVLMPHGYAIAKHVGDSSFTIYPHNRIDKCIVLDIDFRTEKGIPVVGRRTDDQFTADILGQQCTFRYYKSDGFFCDWCTGGLQTESTRMIEFHCYAPEGSEMDRLLAIATSIQKTK